MKFWNVKPKCIVGVSPVSFLVGFLLQFHEGKTDLNRGK